MNAQKVEINNLAIGSFKVPEVGLVHKIILSKHWWPINQLRTDNISQIYFKSSAVIVNEIKYS